MNHQHAWYTELQMAQAPAMQEFVLTCMNVWSGFCFKNKNRSAWQIHWKIHSQQIDLQNADQNLRVSKSICKMQIKTAESANRSA